MGSRSSMALYSSCVQTASTLTLPFTSRDLKLERGPDVHARARAARFAALKEMADEAAEKAATHM